MIRTYAKTIALAALLGGAIVAGCSSNAGFGASPPYQGQQPGNPTNPPVGPATSPYPGDNSGSSSPTPTTPLTVDSASARFAYDASAADPVKAARLVELTFALNNPAASPVPIPEVAVAADTATPTHVALGLQALANQDTVETLIAVAPPKDYSKTKQLNLTFGDGKALLLATYATDFPTSSDGSMTGLDKKRPAGGLSIDDVAVSSITAPGGGLHYDVTFAVTNSSTSDISIASFTVTPPKSDTVKIAVPLKIPARSETTPMSVVVPYSGKSKTLPAGKYVITASDGKTTIAQGSGPLL
jgi:hypothetical protein